MKYIFSLFIIFFSLVFFNSCDTNQSCKDVVCPNNQVCNFGKCLCENGYEGKNCTDLAYEKYIGNYNISKSCEHGNGGFGTFGSIQANGDPVNEIIFLNFLGLGQNAYALIGTDQTGKGNYLRFPSQNLGNAEIIGEGFYEEYNSYGKIRLEIQSTINSQISKCTYTYY